MHLVNICISKAVVGSGCRDASKYVGESVALRDPPASLEGQKWAISCKFLSFLITHALMHLRRAASKARCITLMSSSGMGMLHC